MPIQCSYCIDVVHVPFAESKLDPGPVEVHDHVPEPDAGPARSGNKVPPNVHETFAPPIPEVSWKLAAPVPMFKVPLPAPGTVTVRSLPCTAKFSGAGDNVEGHAPLTNWVPVKVPA